MTKVCGSQFVVVDDSGEGTGAGVTLEGAGATYVSDGAASDTDWMTEGELDGVAEATSDTDWDTD